MFGRKVVFADDKIEVSTTGRDYDCIATIWNKTDEEIRIMPELMIDGEVISNEDDAQIYLSGDDWTGLLADTFGYLALEALSNRRFAYV